ncbi:MAG: hypothetical protein A3I68_06225 [Candidatus Melainabacteria bacterium RIFCSPLOWO2_02_FULL_35_15]|nr:MAG: hypothetical protein A3F80_08185 [Candidatus Melainabacteria bacterium RIFCSPLOWO2_12_FULL_35_11]OGI14562.1 MAG: hypothetical protein A3I68_06225 [Candidatus Melainabacteria bacterium RIFCSPLOWO2_02_FULL_35_15]
MTFFIYLQVALLAFYIILILFLEKGIKLFNPIILISIIYFINFGVSTLYMISMPEGFWKFDFYDLAIINKGLLFSNLVFIFFILGYYSPNYDKNIKSFVNNLINKIPNINNYTLEIKNLILVLIILLIFGWIARMTSIMVGGYYHIESGANPIKQSEYYTSYSQYITIGSMFPLIALVLIFSEWLKNNKKGYLLLSIVSFLLEILYALPSGSKERILLPVSIILFLYSLKKKFPVVPLIGSILLFIFFVFPFVGIYRTVILSGDMIKDFQVVSFLYIRLFENIGLTLNNIFYYIFADRFNYSIIVSSVVHKTPLVWDFKYGYTYAIFFISLIPRILWPGKPGIATFGNQFGRDYGFISPVDYSTSVGMSWVGEMFINFGWFGILTGFFYGLFYRTIYNYFMKDGKLTTLSAIFYVLTLYHIIRGSTFALLFGGLLKILFIFVLISAPFLKKVKRT